MSKSRLMIDPRPRPRADAADALADAVTARWETLRVRLRAARRRRSEPAIHDLRVAMRRLLALFDALMLLVPGDDLADLRRAIRRRLKALNALRDTHVQILTLRALRLSFPVVGAYLRLLRTRERRLIVEAGKLCRTFPVLEMERTLASVMERFHRLARSPAVGRAMRTAASGGAASAYTRVVERRREVRRDSARSIHRLRVAFKKFRYTTEALAPLLSGVTRTLLKEMNRYQTGMGEIQDLEVLASGIRRFTRSRPLAARGSMLSLYQHLARRKEELVNAFLASPDDLGSFWPGSM